MQPHPLGFGDAVLRTEPYVGRDPFLLQASERDRTRAKPRDSASRARGASERRVAGRGLVGPARPRPAALRGHRRTAGGSLGPMAAIGRRSDAGKAGSPALPLGSDSGIRVLAPIVRCLARNSVRVSPGVELELTSGIQEMLARGGRVAALILDPATAWRSVGSPEGYLRALRATQLQTLSTG